MKILHIGVLAAAMVSGPSWAMTPSKTEITDVTLYQGQAQISRKVHIDGSKGSHEVLIDKLPSQLQASSLFADPTDNVEIRAVRYRRMPVTSNPETDISRLDEEIADLQDKVKYNDVQQREVRERLNYIKNLVGFVKPTATTEMSKGVLDADTLKKITGMVFDERKAAMETKFKLEIEFRELSKQLARARQERRQFAAPTTTVNQAVVFIEKLSDGPTSFNLNYIVSGANWTPSYNLRAETATKKATLEYNAIVHQVSGERWDNVNLTLSTATPNLAAAGPGLAPLPLKLTASAAGSIGNNKDQLLNMYQANQQFASRVYSFDNSITQRDQLSTGWQANNYANERQMLELAATDEFRNDLNKAATEQGYSVTYKLPRTVSLASRNDQQMVRILKSELDADLYHVAAPVLTPYVYREAAIKNTSGRDLLNGQINVYLDKAFVGRTEIGAVSRNQGFIVGFGAESQIRARRELVKRESRTQGGNRIIESSYRLRLENYKGTKVAVRLYDRIPYSKDSNSIRVLASNKSHELSTDKTYLEEDHNHGILRWDMELAENEEIEVTYDYGIEFDRNRKLSTPTSAAEVQKLQEKYNQTQFRKGRF